MPDRSPQPRLLAGALNPIAASLLPGDFSISPVSYRPIPLSRACVGCGVCIDNDRETSHEQMQVVWRRREPRGTLLPKVRQRTRRDGFGKVGVGVFYSDSNTQLSFSYYSSPNSFKNVLLYLGSDSGITAASAVALIRATDPTLSFDEAKQVASDCAGEVIEHNGITYAVEYADGGYWMSARIE